MDNIVVRQLRFDFDQTETGCVWSQSSPEFSMFLNALGLHVPYFERFLVKVMRQYRSELTDASLAIDVQAIIGTSFPRLAKGCQAVGANHQKLINFCLVVDRLNKNSQQ